MHFVLEATLSEFFRRIPGVSRVWRTVHVFATRSPWFSRHRQSQHVLLPDASSLGCILIVVAAEAHSMARPAACATGDARLVRWP